MICVCGHEQDRHLGGDGLCGSAMGGDGPPMLCQCECFEAGVTPTVQPVYSDPSERMIPQTPEATLAMLQKPDLDLESLGATGGLLTPKQSKRFIRLLVKSHLNQIHLDIERAIDAELWWMRAMVWTTVFMVPLIVTVPALVWTHFKVGRLQRTRDRLVLRIAEMKAEEDS